MEMQAKARERLEFHKVLARLSAHCAFSAGVELAAELIPSGDERTVRIWQEETAEAIRALDQKVGLSLGGVHDVRDLIFKAQRGIAIEPQGLLDLRDTLRRSTTLRRTIGRMAGQYPRLASLILDAEDCSELQEAIARCIHENGEIQDAASPKLAVIRRELKHSFERLQQKLQRIIHSHRNRDILQEKLISIRSGRYVIPIKAENKGKIAGVVHDSSASGATFWIEPLATVELNNAWREWQLKEEKEIHRILLALSEQAAQQAEAIIRTVEVLAQLDLIRARALLAVEMEAVAPRFVPWPKGNGRADPGNHSGSTLRFRSARHPLLGEEVVPIDVELGADGWILVITGPNTGGKTVTLKTVGLLTLMAHSGMHLPVEEAELSVFSAVHVDIGDEQSIEQSLSTFSSHMTNIIQIIQDCDERSLVLWDELGAGTDPTEGAALARALLFELQRRKVTALVTTHHPELKVFAVQHRGLRNASMEFDLETLSPTFRLISGLPGRSNALVIAEGLGLPAHILAEARQMVPMQDLVADDLLDELHRSREIAQSQQEEALAMRKEAEGQLSELRSRLNNLDEERREILLAARQEADSQLADLREELRKLRASMQRVGVELDPLEQLQETIRDLEERYLVREIETPSAMLDTAVDWAPQLGEVVWLERLGTKGLIIELEMDEALLQVGAMRVRASNADLAPLAAEAQERAGKVQAPTENRKSHAASPGLELDLRGQRVEEAVEHLERYLDAASAAGLPFGRIIHGKGTGALRRAVRERLAGHPLIERAQTAPPAEGGDGVTIARLVPLS